MKLKKMLLVALFFLSLNIIMPSIKAATLSLSNNFPSEYQPFIDNIKQYYPNAQFKAYYTNLDFNDVVEKEDYIVASSPIQARSLMNYNNDGWKSTNSIVYNFRTNTWSTNISGGGKGWYAASTSYIAYNLDPRNLMSYKSVFMFLDQGYSNETTYTEEGINEILKGSFMETEKSNYNDMTFASIILEAGKTYSVSPYFLASRIIQEMGVLQKRSAYISGAAYQGYSGVYNYCNIGASGSDALKGALAYATKYGWTDDYKAITSCAEFIGGSYTSKGQTTNYLQKWNVVTKDYTHQYMQNVTAPESEGTKLYAAYEQSGMLSSDKLVFIIPVYNNMPTCKNTLLTKNNVECNTIPDKRNQNNYLKDLTVNGYTVSNFDAATLTYTINVASSSTTVEVGATAVSAKSTVSGVGTINLTSNNQKINILVTAENESTKTYTLTVTKSDSVPLAVSEIINHSGVKSDGTYISGISLNTTAATLKTKLQSPSKDASIQITSESGKEKTDSILATGDKVIIKSGNETKTYSIVIYGDTNGDGKINAQDYVKIKNYIMGNSLGSVYKEAADADKNGKVNAQDYVKVKNYIMGNTTITQ